MASDQTVERMISFYEFRGRLIEQRFRADGEMDLVQQSTSYQRLQRESEELQHANGFSIPSATCPGSRSCAVGARDRDRGRPPGVRKRSLDVPVLGLFV